MKRILLSTLCAAALGAIASPGQAATATTTFQVSATVSTSCTVTAQPLAFGNYTGAAAAATTTIAVTCSRNATYTIGLDAGTGAGATTAARLMTLAGGGGGTLGYGLFHDATHATNWGNTAGTDTTAGAGTGAAQNYTVYGQIPAGQNSAPGAYLDTINVNLVY